MSLVTCAKQGNSLTTWLNNATQEEKDLLCEALDCQGVTDEEIAAVFLTCDGIVHVPGTSIPTCDEMDEAISKAVATIFAGGEVGQVWTKREDGTQGWEDSSGGSALTFMDSPSLTLTDDEDVVSGGVKISPALGNLLTLRSDGLAVFEGDAPEDLTNIYVDSVNGNDASGTGTIANPFATLVKALTHVRPYALASSSIQIRLHALGEYALTTASIDLKGATLIIRTYGDPIFEGLSTNGGYFWWLAAEATRPTITLPWLILSGGTSYTRQTLTAGSIEFLGVRLVVPEPPAEMTPSFALSRWMQVSSGVELKGVIIEQLQDTNSVIFQLNASTLLFHAVRLDQDPSQPRTRNALASSCTALMRRSGNTAHSGDADRPAYTALDANITSIPKRADGWMDDVSVDRTTKTMFGFTANWDIFAQEI